MSAQLEPAGTSVLGLREVWRADIAPFFEPGEQLQVVVPAKLGLARGLYSAINSYDVFEIVKRGSDCLLVATEWAWLPLIRPKKSGDPITPGLRCARSVRLSVSAWQRFDGLDQKYAIDPMWSDHVRAANDALDAMQAGRPWDLASCGDWVRSSPKDAGNGPLRSIFRISRTG